MPLTGAHGGSSIVEEQRRGAVVGVRKVCVRENSFEKAEKTVESLNSPME
jgi:hypothetical protein